MEEASHSSDSSDGGYDYQFVDTPLDRVICVICHLPSREPHMSECCGHVFCKSCLDKAKATHYTACSMCKDEHFNTFCNKQIDREVQGLHVYCSNKGKGYEWKGEVKDIGNHLDDCLLEDVKCPNQCKEMIQRQFLASHLVSECLHREVECHYCHDKIKLLLADSAHLEECPKVLLPCPNDCGMVETILREDMEAHKKECPLEMIHCEYRSVGCEVRMSRKRQREHEEENTEKHLHMTKLELESTKSELESTKSQLISTNNKVNNLEIMLKTLIGSGNVDFGSVSFNASAVASQVRWSIQLAAMETNSLLDEQTCPVIMKITNYREFERDESPEWFRYFFSHERGYRMQIWFRNWIDNLEISLYINCGPYDDELTWPLRAEFQMTLLNQITDDEHVSITLTYDDDTDSDFNRRRFEDDEHDCYPLTYLISKSDLHKVTPTCAYLRNDCIMWKVCKL